MHLHSASDGTEQGEKYSKLLIHLLFWSEANERQQNALQRNQTTRDAMSEPHFLF